MHETFKGFLSYQYKKGYDGIRILGCTVIRHFVISRKLGIYVHPFWLSYDSNEYISLILTLSLELHSNSGTFTSIGFILCM